MTMSFGLSAGWDEDLYADGGISTTALLSAIGPKAKGLLGTPSSKASELLRRATESSKAAALAAELAGRQDFGITQDITADGTAWPAADDSMTDVKPTVEGTLACQTSGPTGRQDDSKRVGGGIFDDAKPLHSGEKEVSNWVSQAPRTLGRLGSFRASSKGGLLAKPIIGNDGASRIRLYRCTPSGSSFSAAGLSEVQSASTKSEPSKPAAAASLLQALVDAGFARKPVQSNDSAPVSPLSGDPTALLESYSKLAPECFGERRAEVFELLGALFHHPITSSTSEKIDSKNQSRQMMLRLSTWLSRANGRTVRAHLAKSHQSVSHATGMCRLLGSSSALEVDGTNYTRQLEAVFHSLSANSVRNALTQLSEVGGQGVHLDRLAAILAACGGSSSSGRDRRQWLRRQLDDWRRQGVSELMGPELWRIYSVLAGDLEEVVADALDWRTAFGLYLWYYGEKDEGSGTSSNSSQHDLKVALQAFEAAVKLHGSSCRFRPVPSYVTAGAAKPPLASQEPSHGTFSKASPEPYDLEFSALQAAAGLIDRCNITHYDFTAYTNQPLDVSLAWHFSVLLLALLGDETAAAASSSPAFQQLTQQYCSTLESQGLSEWAVYVAHFVSSSGARTALFHKLVLGHASAPYSLPLPGEVQEAAKPHWPAIPPSMLWRARALRSEEAHDWAGAAACWYRSGEAQEQAVSIAVGYLLGPTILRHASAPFQRSAAEAVVLAPMTPAARWLLQLLEQLAPAMAHRDLLWAEVGREALGFLRHWSAAGEERFSNESLVRLQWRSEKLRKSIMGLPW
eukprot:TRINITY_DN24080_c0_g1_i1.p1 TRINITY_DN24080_c0_g1~~TRINITY_DN24080_c0_g1_i1.p1  ORF type:complete len:797 (+),score=168.88 TRINITY_DN24080_c0_g1_i1:58-2448(+)